MVLFYLTLYKQKYNGVKDCIQQHVKKALTDLSTECFPASNFLTKVDIHVKVIHLGPFYEDIYGAKMTPCLVLEIDVREEFRQIVTCHLIIFHHTLSQFVNIAAKC